MTRPSRRYDVTLVIPVFNALEETVDCLDSILASDAGDCQILVNDDGSTAYVGDTLRERFADFSNVIIRTSFRNRGYTANVKFGVEAADTRYVAVINSDTLFPRLWLGKLLDTLETNPCLAAVGPLCNAASYQNVPDLVTDKGDFSANPHFGETALGRDVISSFLEGVFPGMVADMPILNGFCTIFRASSLRNVGGFDATSFPTGYGEENDVCMRLLGAGYRLGVRLDTFVHHLKSRSFGHDRKREYSRNGRDTLARIYGKGFVPSFAKVMDEDTLMASVRFVVGAALGDGRALEQHVEPGADPATDGLHLSSTVQLKGPCTAVIWADRHIVGPGGEGAEAGSPYKLTIGSTYLRIVVPEGRTLGFSTLARIETVLGALAAQSHVAPVIANQVPVVMRDPRVEAARDAVRFKFLYYEEDLDPGLIIAGASGSSRSKEINVV